MSGVIFDTSIYIYSLRQGDASILDQRRIASPGESPQQTLYLSAVVLEELYVGATSRKMKKILSKLENDFEKINRLLMPHQSDWTICGQVLSAIGQKYGFDLVKRARMTNDALIAMTAARSGLTVTTRNSEDFKIIAEFRLFKWREIQ